MFGQEMIYTRSSFTDMGSSCLYFHPSADRQRLSNHDYGIAKKGEGMTEWREGNRSTASISLMYHHQHPYKLAAFRPWSLFLIIQASPVGIAPIHPRMRIRSSQPDDH